MSTDYVNPARDVNSERLDWVYFTLASALALALSPINLIVWLIFMVSLLIRLDADIFLPAVVLLGAI